SREFDERAVAFPEEQRLLFTLEGNDIPWTDISRELSSHVAGGSNTTTLTLYLDVVLGADSSEAANRKLNSCGAQQFDVLFGSTAASDTPEAELDEPMSGEDKESKS